MNTQVALNIYNSKTRTNEYDAKRVKCVDEKRKLAMGKTNIFKKVTTQNIINIPY